MAILPVVQGAVTVISAASGLFAPNDAPRIAKTDEMFQRAVQGDANALLYLKQRTGDYGIVQVPGEGPIGGWATTAAKQYARQKFTEATTRLNLNAQVAETTAQVGGMAQNIANQAGYQILPTHYLWWGAAAVVVLLVIVSRRKG